MIKRDSFFVASKECSILPALPLVVASSQYLSVISVSVFNNLKYSNNLKKKTLKSRLRGCGSESRERQGSAYYNLKKYSVL
jgi:hypothetical protein